jgi:hypothetical protein
VLDFTRLVLEKPRCVCFTIAEITRRIIENVPTARYAFFDYLLEDGSENTEYAAACLMVVSQRVEKEKKEKRREERRREEEEKKEKRNRKRTQSNHSSGTLPTTRTLPGIE